MRRRSSYRSLSKIAIWPMLLIIFFALAIGGNFACAAIPSGGRAVNAAENIGLRNAHVVSRAPAFGIFNGCHENDLTIFQVQGTDSYGRTRTIGVCAPLIGGYTVRS